MQYIRLRQGERKTIDELCGVTERQNHGMNVRYPQVHGGLSIDELKIHLRVLLLTKKAGWPKATYQIHDLHFDTLSCPVNFEFPTTAGDQLGQSQRCISGYIINVHPTRLPRNQ